MKRNAAALAALLNEPVSVQGFTDLAISNLKFSGNAQRRKRCWLLFHGTFLLNFDIALVEKFLLWPSKQPAYRQNRKHGEFLTCLPLGASQIKASLQKLWCATELLGEIPRDLLAEATRKYDSHQWNLRF